MLIIPKFYYPQLYIFDHMKVSLFVILLILSILLYYFLNIFVLLLVLNYYFHNLYICYSNQLLFLRLLNNPLLLPKPLHYHLLYLYHLNLCSYS